MARASWVRALRQRSCLANSAKPGFIVCSHFMPKNDNDYLRKSGTSALSFARRLTLLLIFIALCMAGMMAWQRDATTKGVGVASQAQDERSITGAPKAPNTVSVRNAVKSDSTSTVGVSGQSDPFKAFLDARGSSKLAPITTQPAPQTPQAIRDVFRDAVNRQHAASTASPFPQARNTDSTERSR